MGYGRDRRKIDLNAVPTCGSHSGRSVNVHYNVKLLSERLDFVVCVDLRAYSDDDVIASMKLPQTFRKC